LTVFSIEISIEISIENVRRAAGRRHCRQRCLRCFSLQSRGGATLSCRFSFGHFFWTGHPCKRATERGYRIRKRIKKKE